MSAHDLGWWGTDLAPYRACDGTYCLFPADSLPPLPALDGTFGFLRGAETAFGMPPVTSVLPTDPAIPASFVDFFRDPALHTAVPTCTACYWNIAEHPVDSPVGDGTRLLRFLNDQQDVLFWSLLLEPGGDHRVVAGSLRYHDAAVPADDARKDLIEVAPSFEAFIYRFWVENLAWFELNEALVEPNEQGRAGDQLSPAVRDYLAHYAQPSS